MLLRLERVCLIFWALLCLSLSQAQAQQPRQNCLMWPRSLPEGDSFQTTGACPPLQQLRFCINDDVLIRAYLRSDDEVRLRRARISAVDSERGTITVEYGYNRFRLRGATITYDMSTNDRHVFLLRRLMRGQGNPDVDLPLSSSFYPLFRGDLVYYRVGQYLDQHGYDLGLFHWHPPLSSLSENVLREIEGRVPRESGEELTGIVVGVYENVYTLRGHAARRALHCSSHRPLYLIRRPNSDSDELRVTPYVKGADSTQRELSPSISQVLQENMHRIEASAPVEQQRPSVVMSAPQSHVTPSTPALNSNTRLGVREVALSQWLAQIARPRQPLWGAQWYFNLSLHPQMHRFYNVRVLHGLPVTEQGFSRCVELCRSLPECGAFQLYPSPYEHIANTWSCVAHGRGLHIGLPTSTTNYVRPTSGVDPNVPQVLVIMGETNHNGRISLR